MRQIFQVPAGRLVVDRGVPADGADVLGLYERVLAEEQWFIASPEELRLDPETQGAQIGWLNRQENCCFWTGRIQRALVGAIKVTGGDLRRTRHVGRLEIFVDSRHRGGGVGRALMNAAISWAEENPRLQKLSLNVFDDNERAIHVYRSLGFVEEGRRPGEYRERDGRTRGDVLMARALTHRAAALPGLSVTPGPTL